ncbi:MAG: hypothetical protein NVS9B1_00450 [Candidatus Dormibacteraceae bacterium]
MSSDVERLLEDLRTIGPIGIERAVTAWRRADDAEDRIRRSALGRAADDPEWLAAEAMVFEVAKGESWMSIDQTDRDSAVDAALDALLAILDRKQLGEDRYRRLAGPMATALPWLLSGEDVTEYR